jgi:hypothetical protein
MWGFLLLEALEIWPLRSLPYRARKPALQARRGEPYCFHRSSIHLLHCLSVFSEDLLGLEVPNGIIETVEISYSVWLILRTACRYRACLVASRGKHCMRRALSPLPALGHQLNIATLQSV